MLSQANAFQQMLDDLRIFAGVPVEAVERLGRLLEQQSGFLTDEHLVQLIASCVGDESQRAATFNALQNLQPARLPDLFQVVHDWRQAYDDNQRTFSDEAYADLQQKLPMLIREYPALSRARKADQLRTVLGNELKGHILICDARPVYNEARDRIEGMIPLTTLKLVYERQNRFVDELEITMTPQQLDELISDARKAQQKLRVLGEQINEWLPNGCVVDDD